jgi:hypothetical protein
MPLKTSVKLLLALGILAWLIPQLNTGLRYITIAVLIWYAAVLLIVYLIGIPQVKYLIGLCIATILGVFIAPDELIPIAGVITLLSIPVITRGIRLAFLNGTADETETGEGMNGTPPGPAPEPTPTPAPGPPGIPMPPPENPEADGHPLWEDAHPDNQDPLVQAQENRRDTDTETLEAYVNDLQGSE